MITTIVFDLGGVIISQPKDINDRMIKTMFGENYKSADILFHKYWKDLDLGKMTSLEFLSICKKEFGLKESLNNLLVKFIHSYEIHAELNTDILDLIDMLSRKYRIYILTDTMDAHFSIATKWKIFTHVKRVYASFKEGFWKEDGLAFKNMLVKLKINPGEIIFIDDNTKNINFAKSYKINSILFKDTSQLKKDLRVLKIYEKK